MVVEKIYPDQCATPLSMEKYVTEGMHILAWCHSNDRVTVLDSALNLSRDWSESICCLKQTLDLPDE